MKFLLYLGIWGDDSDEDERPGLGGGKSKKDYSAPIGFISGGVKVGDKVTKEGGSAEEAGDGDSDDEYDREALMEAMARKKKYGRKGTFAMGDAHKDHSMGSWEKHTKGIGQKLLQSMGYKAGQGLGKNHQGITTPVEAFKRKGKAAIGAYGSERTERSLKDYPVKPDSDEEEQAEFEEKLHQWKKGETKKKKVKYVYKTANQLLAEGPTKKKNRGQQSHLSKVKVIDMTGREQRVLSGYHAIGHKHEMPEEELPTTKTGTSAKAFDMPELLHNLDLLVDMAEDEILQNDRQLKHEEDLVVNLQHEKEKADEICAKEEEQIERLKQILCVVETCQERTKPGVESPMTLEDCAEKLKQLQEEFPNEYRLFDLWALSIALVFPLMKREFESWNPLSKPRHGIGIIKNWKSILEDPLNRPYQGGEPHMEPYERLMWEVWMPHIRKALQDWSVRTPEIVIELLEAWQNLLPEWIIDNILEQIVLPKLQDEVDSWNPLTDTMPIHAWLHPWLPLMKDRLCTLHAPIRQKLANALRNWHPSDPSAKMILQPWKGVFQDPQMNAFLVKNILPKLSMCMQEFIINPHQQHLDAWGWVMAWLDLVPLANIVGVLLKHFFPKWLQVLCTWLGNNPNFDEITKWYKGWKSMFGDALLADGQIKEEFNKALELMNRAASGHWQAGARENIAYLTRSEQQFRPQVPPDKRDYPGVRTSMAVPTSFKDLIEKKAEDNNLVFMPLPNKTWEAKQLYSFGKVQIYIDRGVVFVNENNQWIPVSLNNLVEKAK